MMIKSRPTTHWDTKRNTMASNAELAEFLKMKLAAIPIEYTLVRELPTLTPNTLRLMKNKMIMAKRSIM